MRFLFVLVLFIFGFGSTGALSVSQECETALETLFESEITKDEAGEFLKLQGDITLHRLAWTYLKRQKADSDNKIQSIERTITELLNDKYTNANPDFVKAREAFEAQPLSRTALADIAPYLKDALVETYDAKDQNFKLNISDLKLLAALAKQERATAVDGKYDHRMMDSSSPQGMLNFVKLVNSGYKTSSTPDEEALQIEFKLTGLENVMANMQKRLDGFLNQLEIPSQCKTDEQCTEEDIASFFKQSEAVQNIFWESLADKLESDDVLLEKLSYGDLWLKVKANPVVVTKPEPSEKVVPASTQTHQPTQRQRSKPRTESFSNNVAKPDLRMRPVAPAAVQQAGLLIEDPVGIIVRDKAGRARESFEGMGKSFKEAFAQAILADEKVFTFDGKLFDRKTGRQLVPEFALSSLRPQLQTEARDALAKADPKIRVQLAQAWVNGNQTFVQNNKLYNLQGVEQNPSIVIADVMSKKLGTKVDPKRYQGMGQAYLTARANALKNNDPYFRVNNQMMDSYSGRDISSPFRAVAGNADSKIEKNRRRMYENLSDAELIRNFSREHPNKNCGFYGVIDKKKAMLKVYANGGNEVYSSEVLVGAESSDQRTRWTEYSATKRTPSASTGAGIFTIRSQDTGDTFNQKHFNNNILSFKDESNRDTVFAIHQVPVGLEARNTKFGTSDPDDRRISGGCANLKLADFRAMKKWLGPACKVYVLPEEEGNKFVMRDNELKLISTKSVPANKTNLYNFSSNDTKPAKIDIKIVNQTGNTQQSREFVKALEDEKSKLMKIYGLSNDEYNDLAMLSYGILGNESEFGQSNRLKAKEFSLFGVNFGQIGVVTARAIAGKDDATNTSRGLTQIKNLPGGVFSKQYPEINKSNLINPRNSAVATLGYLAEAARTMRRIALDNKEDASKLRITRENMMDYMGYLYQGGASKLKTSDQSKQATPELNAYFRGLQRNMSYIEISQRIE